MLASLQSLLNDEITNILYELEEDDSLESNKLRHRMSVADSRFHGLVEAKDGQNCYTSRESVKDGDPDMSKVDFIGRRAVGASCFGDFGDYEENELNDWELEYTDGGFLLLISRVCKYQVGPLTLYGAVVPEASKNSCRSTSFSAMNAKRRRKNAASAKDS
jgi:hypothetical protein